MLLAQAPHICCTSFLELLHVAELESTVCKVASNRLLLATECPNSYTNRIESKINIFVPLKTKMDFAFYLLQVPQKLPYLEKA